MADSSVEIPETDTTIIRAATERNYLLRDRKNDQQTQKQRRKESNKSDWETDAKIFLSKTKNARVRNKSIEDIIKETEEHNATRVGVGISFKYISCIDSVNQLFTVNFLLRYQWHLTIEDNKRFENAKLVTSNSFDKFDEKKDYFYRNKRDNTNIQNIAIGASTDNIDIDASNGDIIESKKDENNISIKNIDDIDAIVPNTIDFKPQNEPEFIFPNLLEYISIKRVKICNQYYWKPNVKKYPLLVQSGYEILATFSEPLELEKFPFDCQELPIVIESVKNSKQCMLLPEFTNIAFVKFRRRFSAIPEWNILEPYAEFRKTLPSSSRAGASFWQFILKLRVRRQFSFTFCLVGNSVCMCMHIFCAYICVLV